MRILVSTVLLAAIALTAAGCGRQPDTASRPAQQGRIFDSDRSALEKAKTVNDTVFRADAAHREQEQRDTQ